MNDRAAHKFSDPDFVTITDYMFGHKMSFDLASHLGRCEKDELKELNMRGIYTPHVADGAAEYVSKMPSSSIIKLAGILKPHDTLWQGFLQGFEIGLKQREEVGYDQRMGKSELAKLLVAVKKYPELESIVAHHLTLKGIKAEVKNIAIDPEEGTVNAVSIKTGAAPAVVYAVHNDRAFEIGGKAFMGPQEKELERRANLAFFRATIGAGAPAATPAQDSAVQGLAASPAPKV